MAVLLRMILAIRGRAFVASRTKTLTLLPLNLSFKPTKVGLPWGLGGNNTILSTAPEYPMQNLWHKVKPEFLAKGLASVLQDRRRGGGSIPVSIPVRLSSPPEFGSLVASPVRASLAAAPSLDCTAGRPCAYYLGP